MPTKLKSFELQGYKTFATRTEFEFADRVTAIIGPNGSGKSNIADALRWVLGEQSYGLLRGKKTEDMIFAGSETRPRAGMASATILFDNSDGWLPIDFTEVAITRRAYRDGQNEYLLNGQRVRLRDVSELLAQSGLAERTYTVIGQGLVDTALSLKADERRRLFEEAAGIGHFRSRKEEALRRLDTTHRNIERVQDILAELHPRLRSLERQAKRTQEYERIKADLNVYLLDWYGYHWHQAQEELAKLKGDVRNREKLLKKARNAQQELDKKINGFRDRIQELREQLAIKYNDLSKYHADKEFITREIAVTTERIRSLKAGQQVAMSELSRHEEECMINDERIKEAETELVYMSSELTRARIQFEESKQNLENFQARQSTINEQIERLKSELTEILTQKANLDAHTSRIIELNNQKNETLGSISQTIDDLRNELKELEIVRDKILNSLQDAASTRKIKEEALSDFQNKIKDVLAERDRINKNLTSYTVEKSRIHAQLDILDQAENAYQGYTEGTKLLLSMMNDKRLQGGIGSLTNYLTIPAYLELAIASVLGEYTDAFLLKDRQGIEQALDILDNNAIRGVLLPVASLNPEAPLPNVQRKVLVSADEFIGIASDLVDAPENLDKVVDLLLGHVLVVKDRSSAKKIMDNIDLSAFPNLRVVTLKGQVFNIRGPVLTGSSGQTILSRPRVRKELDQELRELNVKVDELTNEVSNLDEQSSLLIVKETKLEKEVADSIASENRIEKDLRQIETNIARVEHNLNWHIEEEQKINKEIIQQGLDLHNIKDKLRVAEQSMLDLKLRLQAEEMSLTNIPLGEQQTEYTFWNSRVAVIERGLSDQERRVSELKAVQERLQETMRSIQDRIAKIGIQHEEQVLKENNLEQEENDLNVKLSELQELISPVESEVHSLEHELLDVQKNDVETRRALSSAEQYYAQARITYSQTQDKLERLRHRIEDDFGIVEYQYADEVSGPTPLPLDGFVEKLPVLQELSIEIDEIIQRLRSQLHRIGPINPEAKLEFEQVSERITFLSDQLKDLQSAEINIREVIAELDLLMEREFRKTFEKVAQEFRQIFTLLFGGGVARLELTEPDDMNETGIEIIARLPGRREQGLSLLSGGERSLTASALIFALLKVSPPPFCVLDEVDAMLDEANVGRFSDMLKEMSQQSQFIIVTHNRGTIQVADVLYGVTMGRDSSSQVISLKLEEVTEEFGV
jgi:chromosome segregation protein